MADWIDQIASAPGPVSQQGGDWIDNIAAAASPSPMIPGTTMPRPPVPGTYGTSRVAPRVKIKEAFPTGYNPANEMGNQMAAQRGAQSSLDAFQNTVENAVPNLANWLYRYVSPFGKAKIAYHAISQLAGQEPKGSYNPGTANMSGDPLYGLGHGLSQIANLPGAFGFAFKALSSPGQTIESIAATPSRTYETLRDPNATPEQKGESIGDLVSLLYGLYHGGEAVSNAVAASSGGWGFSRLYGLPDGAAEHLRALREAQDAGSAMPGVSFRPKTPSLPSTGPDWVDQIANRPMPVARATTLGGSVYDHFDDSSTVRHDPVGRTMQSGPKSQQTLYVSPDVAEKLKSIPTSPYKTLTGVSTPGGDFRAGMLHTGGAYHGLIDGSTVVDAHSTPKLGLVPVEIFGSNHAPSFGDPIKSIELPQVARSTTTAGTVYDIYNDGLTVRTDLVGPDAQPSPRSEQTFYVHPGDVEKLRLIPPKPGRTLAALQSSGEDATAGLKFTQGPWKGQLQNGTMVNAFTSPEPGLVPVESFGPNTRPRFGDPIANVEQVNGGLPELQSSGPIKSTPSAVEAPKDVVAVATPSVTVPPDAMPALRNSEAAISSAVEGGAPAASGSPATQLINTGSKVPSDIQSLAWQASQYSDDNPVTLDEAVRRAAESAGYTDEGTVQAIRSAVDDLRETGHDAGTDSNRLKLWTRTTSSPEGTPTVPLAPTTESAVATAYKSLDAWHKQFSNPIADWADAFGQIFQRKASGGDAPKIPIAPVRLIQYVSDPGEIGRSIDAVLPGERAAALAGMEGAQVIREAYNSGEMQPADTGLFYAWAMLSKTITPFAQDAAFLDLYNGGLKGWIAMAARGDFGPTDLEPFKQWVTNQLKGTPGAKAIPNANSIGRDFLMKAAQKIESGRFAGRSRLQAMHEIISDRDMNGPDMRRAIGEISFPAKMGFNNKVTSLALLATGKTDVTVLDRVRMNDYWGAKETAKKYGVTTPGGRPTADLYSHGDLGSLGNGPRGLALYEASERAIRDPVEKAYAQRGVPEGDLGLWHWETWNHLSNQEADHSALRIILTDKRGESRTGIGVTQGKNANLDYTVKYGFGPDGEPRVFRWKLNDGRIIDLTPEQHRAYIQDLRAQKNGRGQAKERVIPGE